MKKVTNNFAITGFVAQDAEIRQFSNSNVARFPLSIGRKDKEGNRTSALMNIEAWRKGDSKSFDILTKGTMITVEGYFVPNEWTDEQGTKHNRVVLNATKFYETPEEETEKNNPKKAASKKKAKK